MKYVYTHLGLGDHIICNGLIRELVKRHGPLTTFAVAHNAESVRFMYRDIPVTVVEKTEMEVIKMARESSTSDSIVIGWHRRDTNIPFDQSFYRCAELPFSRRWESFMVCRDREREAKLIDAMNLPRRFVFLHENPERGFSAVMNTALPIIRHGRLTNNIFDYLGVLEFAEEIHCIDSSFLNLVNSMSLKSRRVAHLYARPALPCNRPTLHDAWEKIEAA